MTAMTKREAHAWVAALFGHAATYARNLSQVTDDEEDDLVRWEGSKPLVSFMHCILERPTPTLDTWNARSVPEAKEVEFNACWQHLSPAVSDCLADLVDALPTATVLVAATVLDERAKVGDYFKRLNALCSALRGNSKRQRKWTKGDAEEIVRLYMFEASRRGALPSLREIEAATGVPKSTAQRTDAYQALGPDAPQPERRTRLSGNPDKLKPKGE